MIGRAFHLFPGVGDRFKPPVLGVRAAGLKSHHEPLPGGVHDRIAHLKTQLVDSVQYLQTHPHPVFHGRFFPGTHRLLSGGEKHVQIRFRIGDAELHAVG